MIFFCAKIDNLKLSWWRSVKSEAKSHLLARRHVTQIRWKERSSRILSLSAMASYSAQEIEDSKMLDDPTKREVKVPFLRTAPFLFFKTEVDRFQNQVIQI